MTTAFIPSEADRREHTAPGRQSPWRMNSWRDVRDVVAIVALAITALGFAVRQAGAYDTRISALESTTQPLLYMTCSVFGKQYPDLQLPRECDAALSQGRSR